MRILVTGGGGFIGSHLVERLVRDGHDVRVLDNSATGRRENLLPFLSDIDLVRAIYRATSAHMRGSEVPNFISRMMRGARLTVYGDGEQSRDFTYVDNVVEANIGAMEAEGASGRVYNIACGQGVTVNGLVDELQRILGVKAGVDHVEPRPGEIRSSLAEVARARTEIGYEPRVGFEEGLRRTLDFFAR